MTRTVRAASSLLAALLLSAAIAACGGGGGTPTPGATGASSPSASTPPAASASPSATATSSASSTASASGSASGSPSASPSETDDPRYHADPALEALLPSDILGVGLTKLSLALDTYLHDNESGDAKLYSEWMHQLDLSTADGTIAIAHDFSDRSNLTIVALRPKGADPTKLNGAVRAAAVKLSWPVTSVVIAQKDALEVVDPSVDTSTGRSAAAVYSKNGVTYFVVTDDPSLRLAVFIRLP